MNRRYRLNPIDLVIIMIMVMGFSGLLIYKYFGNEIDSLMLAAAEWWKK